MVGAVGQGKEKQGEGGRRMAGVTAGACKVMQAETSLSYPSLLPLLITEGEGGKWTTGMIYGHMV